MSHKISITFTDVEQTLLKDSILDIKDWVEKAVQGENGRAWKTFHKHWMNVLLNDESFTDGIPSNKADFVNLITARSDYKAAKDKFRSK